MGSIEDNSDIQQVDFKKEWLFDLKNRAKGIKDHRQTILKKRKELENLNSPSSAADKAD